MKRPLVKSLPLRGEISNPCSPTAVRRAKYQISNPKSEMSCSAFTLAELLIAIGILGVCVTMAAALFPVAIKEHQKSVANTIGTMVCENAIAITSAVMSHTISWGDAMRPVTSDPSNPIFCYPTITTDPSDPDQQDWTEHPLGSGQYIPDKTRGAIVFLRQVTSGENDYQIVIVAFDKGDPSHSVEPVPIFVDVSSSGKEATAAGNGDLLKRDGVLVATKAMGPENAARYAMIESVNSATETAHLKPETPLLPGSQEVFVIVEKDENGNTLPRNPVMAVMSTRTGLRQ